MIVVADTSPINYLARLAYTDLLQHLYQQVFLPVAVYNELHHPRTPIAVRDWAENLPSWAQVRQPRLISGEGISHLDAGERSAIELAR